MENSDQYHVINQEDTDENNMQEEQAQKVEGDLGVSFPMDKLNGSSNGSNDDDDDDHHHSAATNDDGGDAESDASSEFIVNVGEVENLSPETTGPGMYTALNAPSSNSISKENTMKKITKSKSNKNKSNNSVSNKLSQTSSSSFSSSSSSSSPPSPASSSSSCSSTQFNFLESPRNVQKASSNKKGGSSNEDDMDQDGSDEYGSWTLKEDIELERAVKRFGPKNWKQIANWVHENTLCVSQPTEVNGNDSKQKQTRPRTEIQCLHRWQKVLRPGLVKGPWNAQEDAIVRNCVESGMTRWSEIASYVPGRIGKQCRERWCNHLDPKIRQSVWTKEEDDMLIRLQAQMGNKWSIIAKHINGRTENNVKNRWNSLCKRSKQKKNNFSMSDASLGPTPASTLTPISSSSSASALASGSVSAPDSAAPATYANPASSSTSKPKSKLKPKLKPKSKPKPKPKSKSKSKSKATPKSREAKPKPKSREMHYANAPTSFVETSNSAGTKRSFAASAEPDGSLAKHTKMQQSNSFLLAPYSTSVQDSASDSQSGSGTSQGMQSNSNIVPSNGNGNGSDNSNNTSRSSSPTVMKTTFPSLTPSSTASSFPNTATREQMDEQIFQPASTLQAMHAGGHHTSSLRSHQSGSCNSNSSSSNNNNGAFPGANAQQQPVPSVHPAHHPTKAETEAAHTLCDLDHEIQEAFSRLSTRHSSSSSSATSSSSSPSYDATACAYPCSYSSSSSSSFSSSSSSEAWNSSGSFLSLPGAASSGNSFLSLAGKAKINAKNPHQTPMMNQSQHHQQNQAQGQAQAQAQAQAHRSGLGPDFARNGRKTTSFRNAMPHLPPLQHGLLSQTTTPSSSGDSASAAAAALPSESADTDKPSPTDYASGTAAASEEKLTPSANVVANGTGIWSSSREFFGPEGGTGSNVNTNATAATSSSSLSTSNTSASGSATPKDMNSLSARVATGLMLSPQHRLAFNNGKCTAVPVQPGETDHYSSRFQCAFKPLLSHQRPSKVEQRFQPHPQPQVQP